MSDLAIPTCSAQTPVSHRSVWDRDVRIASALLLTLVVLPHFPLRSTPEEVYGLLDFQLFLRLGLCAVCGVYGLANFFQVRGLLDRFPLAWMALLGAFATVMVPFSASPRDAAAASAVLWCVLLFVPTALLQLGRRRTLQIVLLGSIVYVIGQWVLYFLVPELGRGVELRPGADPIYRLGADSQQLGFQAAVMAGLAWILASKGELSWRWNWLLWGLATVTLAGAKSRTAATAVIVAAGVLLWLRLSPARRVLLVVVAALAIGLVSIALSSGVSGVRWDAVEAMVARSGNSQEIESVTGRTEIWSFVLGKVRQSPIVGWGYCCAVAATQEFDPCLRHAHNEVLNVILGLGIVGAVPLLGMFLQQILSVWRSGDELPTFVTTVAIIAGLTEPVLFLTMPTVLLILWIIVLCRQRAEPLPEK